MVSGMYTSLIVLAVAKHQSCSELSNITV